MPLPIPPPRWGGKHPLPIAIPFGAVSPNFELALTTLFPARVDFSVFGIVLTEVCLAIELFTN